MNFSKLLSIIFLYQVFIINCSFSAEIVKKENLTIHDLKQWIPKETFHQFAKEEIKFMLFTLNKLLNELDSSPSGEAREKIAKNFFQYDFHADKEATSKENQDLIENLHNAAKENNYEEVVDILTKTQVSPYTIIRTMAMSPFIAALCYNHIDIVKLFVWHSVYSIKELCWIHKIFFAKEHQKKGTEAYKPILSFIQNYAPKIARIKSEDMITKVNESYSSFYPTSLFDQVKLTEQQIDMIIDLYDNKFNYECYKKIMAEIEEEFANREPKKAERASSWPCSIM